MSSAKNSECYAYAVDLSAYFDRELDPGRVDPLETHLDGCGSCTANLEQMRELSAAMGKVSRIQAPRRPLIEELLTELDRVDAEGET